MQIQQTVELSSDFSNCEIHCTSPNFASVVRCAGCIKAFTRKQSRNPKTQHYADIRIAGILESCQLPMLLDDEPELPLGLG